MAAGLFFNRASCLPVNFRVVTTVANLVFKRSFSLPGSRMKIFLSFLWVHRHIRRYFRMRSVIWLFHFAKMRIEAISAWHIINRILYIFTGIARSVQTQHSIASTSSGGYPVILHLVFLSPSQMLFLLCVRNEELQSNWLENFLSLADYSIMVRPFIHSLLTGGFVYGF